MPIKYLYKTMLLIISVILLTGCPNIPYQDLKIINNSDKGILWGITLSNVWDKNSNPWTTNSLGNVISTMEDVKNSIWYIKPGGTYIDRTRLDGYKEFLESHPVTYYFCNYDSVRLIPWERIRDERITLKEVTFHSWEEMENCDFTITYP